MRKANHIPGSEIGGMIHRFDLYGSDLRLGVVFL